MHKHLLSTLIIVATFYLLMIPDACFAQYPKYPQEQINKHAALYKQAANKAITNKSVAPAASSPHSVLSALNKIEELKAGRTQNPNQVGWLQSHDTIFVGVVPHDTMRITGNWHHAGPILVLNDGVLLIKNATIVDTGDIYVFQNGQLIADSSSLTFPQQYFYQRSFIAVQNASVNIKHTSFNYSGMSHNLVLGDSAHVTLTKIHEHDWTTCGLYGKPTLSINGCNQAGEYILSDSSTANFINTDTLLLWHQLPNTAVVNYAFPNGDTVYNYHFNNTVAGVSGIKYKVSADTCHDVMWAMMPVNGSNVTISNSKIRAIGAWFQHHDTVNVSHLYDNSNYTNFVAPLADRNLHLINTDVQTWSLYVFDKSHINIDSCQLGEVGTESRASIQSNNFILDGSGGYLWATDTSSQFAFGVTVESYLRSEKNGIFVFEYGWVPYSAPTVINNGIMICVQSTTGADPIALDAGTAWLTKIDSPDTSYVNMLVPVVGSAWINWGPNGTGWLNFAKYSLYYQLQGATTWNPIVIDSLTQIHHNTLGVWNTFGLSAGNYYLMLKVKDNFNDSVYAITAITLLANPLDIKQVKSIYKQVLIYPNPNNGTFTLKLNDFENTTIEVYNNIGQRVYNQALQTNLTQLNLTDFSNGIYQLRVLKNNTPVYQTKVVKQN